MLVPEVMNLDDEHLKKLSEAKKSDLYLSDASPLNVLFWNIDNSAAELARKSRISKGHPGSPCVNKHAAMNTEYSEIPLCTAGIPYQKKKLAALVKENLPKALFERQKQFILDKACICHDLAGAATKTLGIDEKAFTALTPGPNIINFSKISSLKEMVDHIYGRINLITSEKREHMFIKELELYIEQFKAKFDDISIGFIVNEDKKQLLELGTNLLEGISYYKELSDKFTKETKESFLQNLNVLTLEIQAINKKVEVLS